MTKVNDENRKRRFTPRPSRRVAYPMRTYAFKLGGKQAEWLDGYIRDSEMSTSEALRGLIQRIIRKKSGITPEYTQPIEAIDVEALKQDLMNYIVTLLNDQKRAPMMHTLTTQAVQGNGITEAEIANMLEGFNYD